MSHTHAAVSKPEEVRDIERFVRSYQAGEVIFARGEVGRSMFVVVEGGVEIFADQPQPGAEPLKVLSVGDFFGEIAVLIDGVRTATARVGASGARLAEIDKARFIYLVGQQPAFALTIMRSLAARLGALTPHSQGALNGQ